MLFIAIRECGVLLLAVVVSYLASLAGNAGQDFGALAAAIIVPIVFCLVRAALAKLPQAHSSGARHTSAQFALGFAFISLLIFEMGVAMFAGAQDIPAAAWLVVAAFGLGYVGLFVIAYALAGGGHHAFANR